MAYAGILKNRHIKHWFTKNQTFLKRLINNIITSGRFDNCDYEIRRKIILLNIICVIGIISLCFQGFSVLAGNNLLIGVLDLSAALLLSFNILLLRRGDYYSFVSQSSIVLIAVLFYYLLISGGIHNTGFLWYFTFPLCAVFLLGSRKGVIAALILLFFTLLFFFNEHNSTIFTIYTPEFESRFVLTFLLVLSFSYIFENMRERTQYRIAQNNKKFEKLISELKEKDKLLCNLHNNLELRVSERTLKLQKEIKQREQAEQELEESVERFRSLYENATIGIYRSTPSGKVLMANPALIRMLGYNSFEEISKIDLNYSGYMEMDGRKKFIELLEEKNSVSGLEAAWEKKDGNKVFLRESAAAIRDKKGKTLYYEGTVEDITIQKKLDEQLSQSHKMETVGQLAGAVAHDFNNLLTVILGNSELGLAAVDKNKPVHKRLHEIKKAAKLAESLTGQLLAFSRKHILKPKMLNLNDLILNTQKMLKRLIREDIKLVIKTCPDLADIKADAVQIEQVLMNLVINASDALPDGGKIIIETENVTIDEAYVKHHEGSREGRFVMFSVSDNGCGMDSNTKYHIFDPFFTTKEQGKGTGMGLATVYGIIKQTSGNIWVYSEKGIGTTFKIYLPQVNEQRTLPKQNRVQNSELTGSETILIVEDENKVRGIIADILNEYGYSTLMAKDGESALGICDKYKHKIQLVLTDIIMPQMNGRQMAEKLHTINPGLKILFMSGYTDNAIVYNGLLDEGNQFIPKPVSPLELTTKIRKLLDE